MKNILLLFLIIGINEIYAQNKVQKIIEFNSLVDTVDNKTVKTFEYDQNGNLVKENYINFMPLNSKYRNTGTWIYEYNKGQIQKSYKINRPERDTILIEYKYRGNKKKITTKELVTRSKLKDSVVDKYGIDGKNGCIIAPEDLEFYKIWVERENKAIIRKKGKIIKERVYFNQNTNPYDLIYEYDSNGQLSKLIQINRKTKKVNWTENYIYDKKSTVREREYFIEYWNKIPPKELEIKYYNENGKITRIELSNSKDYVDGVIEITYESGLISKKTLIDKNGNSIREHKYVY
ncbi:hypothetical protein SAMN04487907_1226 [Zunongwangia mangrovi]|uniref:Uncharacterized protein n=1 Tax=Zunongwangia mangrovi TaxID=1334022 RepID=A0A1I1NMI4_9FLAO|nr:hypothetical protein [Zunongwangia mangrovi]SFC94950.1 hypothetical protein SAMN04487907_1226 [Zunongwangia mangrovi]